MKHPKIRTIKRRNDIMKQIHRNISNIHENKTNEVNYLLNKTET